MPVACGGSLHKFDTRFQMTQCSCTFPDTNDLNVCLTKLTEPISSTESELNLQELLLVGS